MVRKSGHCSISIFLDGLIGKLRLVKHFLYSNKLFIRVQSFYKTSKIEISPNIYWFTVVLASEGQVPRSR
jgi:hypothetical protein